MIAQEGGGGDWARLVGPAGYDDFLAGESEETTAVGRWRRLARTSSAVRGKPDANRWRAAQTASLTAIFFMAAAKPVRAVGATTVGWSGAILDEGRESGDGVSAENGANDRRGGEAENGAPPEYFTLHLATLISQRARSAAHRAHRADKAFRSVTSLLNSARWETKFLEERVMEAG